MTRRSSGNVARFLAIVVALAIVVVSVAFNLMVQTLAVPSDEMEPAIPAGSHVIALVASEAKLDDIITFRHPQQPQTILVRRVAAVGGEGVAPGGWTGVPPDHYFVLGDNGDTATDSRHWGPVPRKNLIARVRWVFVWPGGVRAVQ